MKVKIGPIEYEIVYAKIGDGDIGEISFRKGEITIDDIDMQDQIRRQVLCHEIAHAMLMSICRDEAATDALANGLLMFVRDNPEVVAFLQKP